MGNLCFILGEVESPVVGVGDGIAQALFHDSLQGLVTGACVVGKMGEVVDILGTVNVTVGMAR